MTHIPDQSNEFILQVNHRSHHDRDWSKLSLSLLLHTRPMRVRETIKMDKNEHPSIQEKGTMSPCEASKDELKAAVASIPHGAIVFI